MSWTHWPTPSGLPGVVAAPPMQPAMLQGGMNSSPLIPTGSAPGMHYTPEQWAQMQQQNWQQWAQWQQQYQQWHQQYGAEYSKSINAMAANQVPVMETNTSIPPPPPAETKPPPPPPPDDNKVMAGYMTAPPPTQVYNTVLPQNENRNQWQNNKRPYTQGSDYENTKRQMLEEQWKKAVPPLVNQQSKMPVTNLEELTQAERKFDKEFAAWEAQFNKWKEQNSTHPDKIQFLEYEKKWESWRNSLLERREQMRKKRLALQSSQPKSVTPHTFNEPPSNSLVSPNIDNLYSKPPPTQNNEPLAFKESKGYPGENISVSENIDGGFLQSSSPTSGGIPGLDLVKEGDLLVDKDDSPSNGPDFDAISKGINTILGDPKLMNMLSMVQKTYSVPPPPLEDHYNPNQRETVNNFDDQTQMSFSAGQDVTARSDFIPSVTDSKMNQYNKTLESSNFNQERKRKSNYGQDFNSEQQEPQDISEWTNFSQGRGSEYDNRSEVAIALERPIYNQNRSNFEVGLEERNFNQNKNYDSQIPEEWNEEDSFERYHNQFSKTDNSLDGDLDKAPLPEEDFFVPEVVIDYEHRILKESEPEVSLECLRMFDYRHKNVNRIPYPQRPVWFTATLGSIRQFDPLGAGRYPSMYEREFSYRDREDSRPEKRLDNEKDYRSEGRSRVMDFGRRDIRLDDSPRNRETRWRIREKHNSVRDRTDIISNPHKPLDLEELSDGDWSEDNEHKEETKLSVSKDIVKTVHTQDRPVGATSLDQLIGTPGRFTRPPKIVIILRGPPGSGKTHLAKLIKDREVEKGGSAPRILSLDDYFMVEQEKEVVQDGKTVKIKEMVYEYEREMEEIYRQSLIKSFKKTVTDGYFNFIVVDNVNQKVKNFGEMWSFAKQHGFQVYICELELDPQVCSRRNVHNRTQKDIEDCISGWEPTPSHHPTVDPTEFLHSSGPITEVEMEEVEETSEQGNLEVEDHIRSKWDTFDCSLNNLARLDGVNKPLRSSKSMEEYLQLDEEWTESSVPLKPGQKRVRWADLEEQKQQKKMKALGFVVGHTDWNRMMNPSNGEDALIQTKYIERVGKY